MASSTLSALLDRSTTIAVLTGAGVSTDSGIPDFKTLDEAWPFKVKRAEALTLDFFHRDPRQFWEAYRYIFTLKQDVQPNSFHHALANLEKTGKEVIILTQNVDGLHTTAGSSQVGELHGSLKTIRCSTRSCNYSAPAEAHGEALPRCPQCRKLLRPDVVLFGEAPRLMGDAKDVAYAADLLIVAGTSLDVYPVASLPELRYAFFEDKPMVWMNRVAASTAYPFTCNLVGELSSTADVLNAYVEAYKEPLPALL